MTTPQENGVFRGVDEELWGLKHPETLEGARKGAFRGTTDTVLDKVGCNFLVWEGRNSN